MHPVNASVVSYNNHFGDLEDTIRGSLTSTTLFKIFFLFLFLQELSRSVQLHEKVRARELREKNEKYKRAVEQMKRLEKDHRELQEKLKVCYVIFFLLYCCFYCCFL